MPTVFSTEHLFQTLSRLQPCARFIVAYSGGVDSHVLLHALARLRDRFAGIELHALHIDHGLNANSARWAQHCESTCAALDVAFTAVCVDAQAARGESPEDAARRARYAQFEVFTQPGDVLLLAHHQDDQAETMLLQLLRGAGPRGLAAMAAVMPFGFARIARPLLDFTRADLAEYANDQGLEWIDDPSNADVRFDRNYLRRDVMPLLKQRWPAATTTLARSAQHCAEAAHVLGELAHSDIRALAATAHGTDADALSVAGLNALSAEQQRNVLRAWIEQRGLPLPQHTHLEHIQNDVLSADVDAQPCVEWPGAQVRRYRDALYALPPFPAFNTAQRFAWDTKTALPISGVGILHARRDKHIGVRAELCAQGVQVRFRSGGERLKPVGRAETHALKNLFQDAGVPPWRRERVPLIFLNDELIAVVGFWYASGYTTLSGEGAVAFELETPPHDRK